ncbi:MAG: InlB B-repeat-containing protein [Velocimicrobium sp.]
MRDKKNRPLRSGLALLLAIVVVLTSVVPDVGTITASAAATKTTTLTETKKTQITVTTQKMLTKALADKKIKKITIQTKKAITFTIPKKSYQAKTLVIRSSKASVVNSGIFKGFIVTNAKSITEKAKGNSVIINDSKLTYKVAKGSKVKTLTYNRKNAKGLLSNYGTIDKIILAKKAKLIIKGRISSKLPIQIKTKAKGSAVTSSVPSSVSTATDADIILKSGAEGSLIASTNKDAKLTISNQTKKSVKYSTPNDKTYIDAHTKMSDPDNSGNDADDTNDSKPSPSPSKEPRKDYGNGGSSEDIFSVTFESNGGTAIDAVTVKNGKTITSLPAPQKSNSIFLGWYADKGFQKSFTDDTPILRDITLYARYSEIEMEQQSLDDSFSLTDQQTGLSFQILSTDSAISESSVISGITVIAADGSEAIKLKAQGSEGSFVVSAQGGFTEGVSYNLTLSDSKLNFKDQENTVRKCDFTIHKAEVYNIELHDGIFYIPDSLVSDMTEDGEKVDALSVPVVGFNDGENTDEVASGSFTYKGNTQLQVGDVLCIYSEDKPKAPTGSADDSSYLDDDIAYIKVVTVTGSMGSQNIQYMDADAKEVIFIPDVLPIAAGVDSKLENYVPAVSDAEGSFMIETKDLDFSAYEEMGLSEKTTVDKGDFIALYSGASPQDSKESEVSYGEITSVKEENGTYSITYVVTNQDKMQDTLDYYSKNSTDGDSMLKDVDVDSVEEEIEDQVVESGYAEKASLYMTALALETDGFNEMSRIGSKMDSLSIKMEDGSDASVGDVKLMAASASGSKVKIKNLKVNANIGKNLQKLSGKGVRCAVSVSFDVSVKATDDSVITISLSSTFIEELKMDVSASGKAVWKKKWIFKYISDYTMNANIDIYNYTGISFKAVVSTKSTSIDVSKQIQKIMASTKPDEISGGVKELFELYSDMMGNETDWIDIFDKNIISQEQHLLLGIIAVKESVDFVVSANINVALGCNFEYENGTRYCFWAKIRAKDAGSNTVSLMDEKYTFQFYVMGSLGLRAGIRLEFAVGLFSTKLDSVGLTAEAGIYTKLYGYFFYQLQSVNQLKNSKMSGALYLDFGIYLELAFKAQVLNGKYQYNPTLYENEWPLLSAGTKYNVYDFSYDTVETPIKMKDTIKTYTLPDDTFSMTYLDLKEGDISKKTYKADNYNISFTNSKFSLSGNEVKVSVPSRTHKLESDMTITWKGTSLAFSSMPISRTFHLVWDDVNDNGYTIAYNSMGGSSVSNSTYFYETTIKAPTAPVRKGYAFGGWYKNEKLTTPFVFQTMPAENIILYAKWIPNTTTQYQVEHYQQNLANDTYTLYETENLTGTTGQTVAAKAKSYQGFTYDSSVDDSVVSGTISAEGSLVLRQYYKRNSYTLAFKPENGSTDIVKTLKYGAAIFAPAVVKTGYTFSSWNSMVATTMPANNQTYTAIWTPNNYSIEFDSTGGSEVSKITTTVDSVVSAPSSPIKAGYLFEGWYRDRDLMTPYSFSTMEANNITLYAKWKLNSQLTYKVEHYQQNVSGDGYTLKDTENLTGAYNATVTAKEKTYSGYVFNSQESQTVKSGVVAADGSLVLKLYYDRDSYNITLKTNNQNKDIVQTLKYGVVVSVPEVTREGYNFGGWYSDSELTNAYTFDKMPAENITVYASWMAASYMISFNTNGGSILENVIQDCNTSVSAPKDPTKQGYSFGGWCSDSALSTTYTFDKMPAENITIYAKWVANSYTITADSNGGSKVGNITQDCGTTINEPTAPTREGYLFAGWYSDPELNAAYTFDTMPAEDSTVYAKWTANSYTITFDSNGGTSVENITQDCGTAVSEPTAPTKEGYRFAGWYSDSKLSTAYSFGTMPIEDITVYASWTINQYTITFNTNEGSMVNSITQAYKSEVSAPENPTREGYSFIGWYKDSTLSTAYTFGTMPAEDSTVYAKWTANSYTITFDSNGGTSVENITQDCETAVSEPTAPTKEGYRFAGWYSDSELSVTYSFGTMPIDNITVYASWTINQYTITFNTNEGSMVDSITQEYGSQVSAPENPAREGYSFIGWYTDSTLSTAYIFGTMPAEDSTVYVKWTANSYTITFDSNGGTSVENITQECGTAVSTPMAPTKEEYRFAGWYSDSEFSTAYSFDTMPTDNITVYAKWVVNGSEYPLQLDGDYTVVTVGAPYATDNVSVKVIFNGSIYILYIKGLDSATTVDVTGFQNTITGGWATVASGAGWNCGTYMTNDGKLEIKFHNNGSTSSVYTFMVNESV